MPNRWCSSAALRRRQIENGLDLTFSKVFVPYFIDAIEKYKPSSVLELGCGTGHMALELSKYCEDFTAIEPSSNMYAVAKEVLKDSDVLTLFSDLAALSREKKYDFIYAHMCLHVIKDIESLLKMVKGNMGQNSLAIFSIPNPCFYNDYKSFFDEYEYDYMRELDKNVSFSITKDGKNMIKNVPYHHRPISYYLNLLAEIGFRILKFDEIYPSKKIQLMYGEEWNFPRYCSFVVKND